MTISQTGESTLRKPLRLWPGVVLVTLLWLFRFVVPVLVPAAEDFAGMAWLVCGLGVILWWLFFSRAPWSERVVALLAMIAAVFATKPFLHESIATGAMGFLFYVLVLPGLCLALVAWAVISRRLSSGPRWAAMAAAFLIACGAWTLARTGGFSGAFDNDLAWRWSPTPEDRLLAEAADEPMAVPPKASPAAIPAAPPVAETPVAPEEQPAAQAGETPAPAPAAPAGLETGADWPGFRGPERDGVVHGGVRIATDWAASPPVELWRRPIGPAWSSFAVRGGLLYTQEQRGEEEVVSCYDLATGKPVWMHRDAARFWESNGGAGPRGTPTLSNGRVYALGATGILNALDAGDGSVVWTRNAASDTGAKLPGWGFAGSPLVVGDVVVVATAGKLAAYDLATGEPRWLGREEDGGGYSSPHLVTIGGVAQVLLMSGAGASGVALADGTLLWKHPWKGDGIVQPALTADSDVLIGSGSGMGEAGLRRLAVARGPGGWTVEERWTTNGLKPYFNDFVVHEGHAYGFDGRILASVGLEDGKRKWKGGRYGNGQLVLLPDQDLLLVLSEKGELALVRATPDEFAELARVPAIEGKTWNHPVLAGDVLLVRNGEEMVAFRLARAGG